MSYIIFGAGQIGHEALELIGEENVKYFIDNSPAKIDLVIQNKKVYSVVDGLRKREAETIVVAIAKVHEQELIDQLIQNGADNFCTFSELRMEITREKILKRPDYIGIYNNAVQWIKTNSVKNGGVINNSKLHKSYPEVTGYYIPTLLRWGYRGLAVSYADWLCSIQKEDGSWYDTMDEAPYIFDSAQILKGLLSVRTIYSDKKKINKAIIKGCDWILSCMTEEGQLKTPTETAWGNVATELIHTYCLSPLVEAANIYKVERYEQVAKKILEYYKANYHDQIINFSMLSHFYSYVVEAMLDMGEVDLAKEAMRNMEKYQKASGAVPAYKDVDWVCSTGLFQLALIWFRLGDSERGSRAFEYACKLQNKTGGWYGSYISEENPEECNTYFPDAEISWANKYFLDALYYKNVCQFESQAAMFRSDLLDDDQKYIIIKNEIANGSTEHKRILDVGCGKGRYIIKLAEELPENEYFAVDISTNVMKYFDNKTEITKTQGGLTCIPYEDDFFNIVYTCEALEHAVDIKSAVREICRVVMPGGKIIIIDKNKSMYGYFDIEQWEQWFDKEELKQLMLQYCSDVFYTDDIDYDGRKSDGLFGAWIGTVR